MRTMSTVRCRAWVNVSSSCSRFYCGTCMAMSCMLSAGTATGHGGGQTGGLQLIDLHGLHAKEAVEVLKREVKGIRATRQASRQPGATVRVSVIVGTGHHTKVPPSILQPF